MSMCSVPCPFDHILLRMNVCVCIQYVSYFSLNLRTIILHGIDESSSLDMASKWFVIVALTKKELLLFTVWAIYLVLKAIANHS